MYLVTAHQMQKMDQETIHDFGIPGTVLMESAGRGALDFFIERYSPGATETTAVIAGRGNNGGDGFVMARYLLDKNINTTVYLFSSKDKIAGDARLNMELFIKLCDAGAPGALLEITDAGTFQAHRNAMCHHSYYIDALLGTGLNSDVRDLYKNAVEVMNTVKKPVFSVDIPSGLNADTGHPMGCSVKADATATFGFAKAGHIFYPGNTYTGQLKTIDIGIPDHMAKKQNLHLSLMEKKSVGQQLPKRGFDTHKGRLGHLLAIGGAPGKTGAAVLCTNAAMRCGTGLVTLAVAKGIGKVVEPLVIEAMTDILPENEKGILSSKALEKILELMKSRQALALGPGIGTHKSTIELVEKIIAVSEIPVVLDADGINCIRQHPGILKQKKAPVILTPHPGEMARLANTDTETIQKNRPAAGSDFAKAYDVIVVLKGAQTLVCLPDGRIHICPTGNPGMASGGMGDVLTGMIAGFCAQGLTPENACICGVYIHGSSADILAEQKGPFGFIASDIISILPKAMGRCLS